MTLLKATAAAIVAAALLSGCDNSPEFTDKDFAAARQAAISAPDTMQALKQFRKTLGDYGTCSGVVIGPAEARTCQARDDAEREILMAGIAKGSVSAYAYAYDDRNNDDLLYSIPDHARYLQQHADHLTALADSAETRPENGKLLFLAGQALQNGWYATQDSARAIGFFLRTWQAGYTDSAGELADTYKFLKDKPRAYFWQLRSHQGVTNSTDAMTGGQILEIQRLAADKQRLNL